MSEAERKAAYEEGYLDGQGLAVHMIGKLGYTNAAPMNFINSGQWWLMVSGMPEVMAGGMVDGYRDKFSEMDRARSGH